MICIKISINIGAGHFGCSINFLYCFLILFCAFLFSPVVKRPFLDASRSVCRLSMTRACRTDVC